MHSRKSDKYLVFFLALLVGIGSISISIYLPSLNHVKNSLMASTEEIQQSYSIFFLGYAIAQLWYGPLADRYGRRRVLIAGLGVYILGCLIASMASSVAWLIIGRLIQGLGVSVGPAIGRAVCRDLYEGDRLARAFSIIAALIALSPAIAPSIGGILTDHLGWRSIFISLSLLGMMLALILYCYVPETLASQSHQQLRIAESYKEILRNWDFLKFTLSGSLVLSAWFVYVSSAAVLFSNIYKMSASEIGFVTIFTSFGYFLGTTCSARFSSRISLFKWMLCGLSLCLLAGLTLVSSGLFGDAPLPVVLGAMTTFSAGMGITSPNSSAGSIQPFPHRAGSASALYGFIMMSLSAAATSLSGLAVVGSIQALGAWIVSLIALAGAALLVAGKQELVAAVGENSLV